MQQINRQNHEIFLVFLCPKHKKLSSHTDRDLRKKQPFFSGVKNDYICLKILIFLLKTEIVGVRIASASEYPQSVLKKFAL